jgi:CspA family cold shock protein
VAKRTKGIVRWYDGSRGYGYIQAQDGEDVFVHYSDISGGGLQLLRVGDEVDFFMETSIRGWQATDVTRLN